MDQDHREKLDELMRRIGAQRARRIEADRLRRVRQHRGGKQANRFAYPLLTHFVHSRIGAVMQLQLQLDVDLETLGWLEDAEFYA